jgi:hypothetical protein
LKKTNELGGQTSQKKAQELLWAFLNYLNVTKGAEVG